MKIKFCGKNSWKHKKDNESTQGEKSFYRCAINYYCKASIYQLYQINSEAVQIYRNVCDHDHSKKKESRRISKDVQEEITLIYKKGTKTPLKILYVLRF